MFKSAVDKARDDFLLREREEVSKAVVALKVEHQLALDDDVRDALLKDNHNHMASLEAMETDHVKCVNALEHEIS